MSFSLALTLCVGAFLFSVTYPKCTYSQNDKKELEKGMRLVCEFEYDKTDAEDTYVLCR